MAQLLSQYYLSVLMQVRMKRENTLYFIVPTSVLKGLQCKLTT